MKIKQKVLCAGHTRAKRYPYYRTACRSRGSILHNNECWCARHHPPTVRARQIESMNKRSAAEREAGTRRIEKYSVGRSRVWLTFPNGRRGWITRKEFTEMLRLGQYKIVSMRLDKLTAGKPVTIVGELEVG
jgi:hypothetical protein